jgi:hypothetical protein
LVPQQWYRLWIRCKAVPQPPAAAADRGAYDLLLRAYERLAGREFLSVPAESYGHLALEAASPPTATRSSLPL